MRRSTVIRLASAATDTPATTVSSSAGSATGARSSTSLPLMIRETSRMSSISRACSRAFRPITSIACCARAEVRVPLCSIGTQPRIAFNGVRSSCDSVARNSSLSRLASSAAASRASSASLRRVTITHTPLIATGRPSRYSTRPLPSHQRTVPSGATMRYSTSCWTPSVRARCTEASTRGAIVRMDLPLVAGEGAVEGAGRQAVDPGEVVGPPHGVGDEIPVPRAHRRGVEREAEPLLAAPRVFLGAGPLDRKGDLRGDQAGQLQLVGGRRGRRGVIQHELADDPVEADQRDEGHRGDALGLEGRPIGGERGVGADVGDDDRLRLRAVRRPGRMALDRLPVGVGQPAVGLEPHHAVGVEQQDRGALDAEPRAERIERRRVDLLDGAALGDRPGEVEDRRVGRVGRGGHGGRLHRADIVGATGLDLTHAPPAVELPTHPGASDFRADFCDTTMRVGAEAGTRILDTRS